MASCDDIEEELLGWCNERLGAQMPIAADTDLLEEGLLDSLLIMDLIRRIERRYALTIANDDIAPRHFRTVQALAALIAQRLPE